MGSWFWLNVPLMVVIFGCVAGIPLWLNLTRWKDEIEERHAEIAAAAGVERIPVQSTLAMAAGADEIEERRAKIPAGAGVGRVSVQSGSAMAARADGIDSRV